MLGELGGYLNKFMMMMMMMMAMIDDCDKDDQKPLNVRGQAVCDHGWDQLDAAVACR